MATRKRYLESAEQKLFVKRWRLDPRTRDLPSCAIPNAARRGPITASIVKAEGMEAGVPDWMCFQGTLHYVKDAVGFVGLALEFKRPDGKGRVSPAQQAWHEKLRDNGWRVEVVTGAEQAWQVVLDYLGLEA